MTETNKTFFQKNRVLTLCATILCSALLLIALSPSLISTDWGKNQLVKIANQFIPGSIEIKTMHLSWFGPQHATGIQLKDPSGTSVATIEAFSTDASLWNALRQKFNLGFVQLHGINATIIEDSPGVTNLQRALLNEIAVAKPNNPSTHHSGPFTVKMENVDAELNTSSVSAPVTIHFKGQTKQGDQLGNFDVNISLTGVDTNQWKHVAQNSEIALNAHINQFPVAIVDYLIALKHPEMSGIACSTIGKTLNLVANTTITQSNVLFAMQANAARFSTKLEGQIHDDTLILSKPGTISFVISPEMIQHLASLGVPTHDLQLINPAHAKLVINELGIPLSSSADQFLSQVFLKADLNMENAEFRSIALQKIFELRKIHADCQIPLNSQSITANLQGDLLQAGQTMHYSVTAAVDKPVSLNNWIEHVREGSEIKAEFSHIPLEFVDNLLGQNNTLTNALGKQINFTAQSKFAKHQGQFTLNFDTQGEGLLTTAMGNSGRLVINSSNDQLHAQWTSPLANATLKGSLNQDGSFSINEPMSIAYTLTPKSAQFFNLTGNGTIQLDKPTIVHLLIHPFKKPVSLKQLSDLQPANLTLSGQVSIDDLALTYLNNTKAAIHNLYLPWEMDSKSNSIKVGIQGKTQLAGNKEGSLKGDALISQWLKDGQFHFYDGNVQANLQLNSLPVVFLGALTQHEELVEILGSTIDVNLNASSSPTPVVEINLHGNGFEGAVMLALGDAIKLHNNSRPATFKITFTPERFQAVRHLLVKNQKSPSKDPLKLVSPATLIATISSLHIPWNTAAEPAGWIRSSLKASLEIDGIKITDTLHNQHMNLEKIVAQIDTQHLAKQIKFNIDADENTTSTTDNETNFSGTLENALTSEGSVNIQDLSLNLKAKSRRLQVGLLCHMIFRETTLRDKIEALFGPTMDIDATASLRRMNGPLYAQLQGKNGRMTVDALLKDGNLTLKNPLDIQVAVTPQLGKSILQDAIPILSGAIAAQQPIKITVDPQGFSFPVRNWDLMNFHLGRATIDLGKIQFTNQGELGNIFALLKPSSQDTLSVWFTPLYMEMADGVLTLHRMDMLLLNRYPIALWGKMNFPKDKVDMSIGLTGTALSKALNIEGIEKDYMMQLPFKGTIGEAYIDKAKATARISALVAQNQGGPHGVILGAVLDIAGGSLSEKKPPEPTTKPLPWDSSSASSSTAENSDAESKKHHHKSHKIDAAKVIEQGASTIIDSLFR